ncbi:MAG: MG2 domain-containing protein, partial [Desulfobulbaceae bacterium]|nr:MG2 domain-containing protein [Desulfobulbaceae bacterium]
MRWIVPILLLLASSGVKAWIAQAAGGGIYEDVVLEVLDIGERSYDGGNALAVSLSVPLDSTTNHSGYFNVTRSGGDRIDGDWVLSESGSTLYFPYIEPRSQYTVTVYQGLTASNGSVLARTYIVNLETRDIASALTFGGRGLILPSENSPGLPVVTVNVSEADIEFHRVHTAEIVKFMGSFYGNGLQNAYDLKRFTEYCTLVYSGRFRLDPPLNKRRTANIPITDIKELSEPGLYLAVMKQPGTYDYRLETTCFMISDLGLHARSYRAQIDVYVQSLASGDPLSGVEVKLWGEKGGVLARSITSPRGVAVFNIPPGQARLITASSGPHFSVLELNGPALDLSEFEVGGRQQQPMESFISAPRDIYRPGETVVLSMLLRSGDGELMPNFPVPCAIKGPGNKSVREFVWHSSGKGGYYQYEYKIPDTAATGTYQLVPTVGGTFGEPFRFKVEEFLPERMELEFEDHGVGPRFIKPEEELQIGLRGIYLYGAPANGNRLSSSVRYFLARKPLSALSGYLFGDEAATDNRGTFELDDLLLDQQGAASLQITPRWRGTSSPLSVEVNCSLHESGGRPVSRRVQYIVWPAESLIGLRPLFGEDDLETVGTASYEVIAATREGVLVPASGLQYKFIRSERDYFWVYDEFRGWRQDHTDKSYTVLSGTLAVTSDTPTQLDLPVENGHYRLEIKQPESGTVTAHEFNVGNYWQYGREKSEIRPDSLAMFLDKQRYKGGDTARLTISSPHPGKGFVVVEADEPLWSAPLEIIDGPVDIEIPVDPAWKRHDIYVSAMVLRPVSVPEKINANRAMGVVHLPLDRERRRLEVAVESSETIEPSTLLAVNLKVRDADDQPVGHAMVTLAAVDVGALNVTAYPVPDPFVAFFGKRRYGVESHDLYSKVIEAMEGKTASLSFGGDADLSRGGTKPKSEVRIVSLFNGPVELDPNGHGTVELDIPDFNGRLRLAALAFSDDKFGSSGAQVTVAAPVVAELGLPRFLAPGDESTITLDLVNMTEIRQKISWRLDTDEELRLDQQQGSADLAAGEKIIFPCLLTTVGHLPSAALKLTVTHTGEGESPKSFTRQYRLGIRPPYPA